MNQPRLDGVHHYKVSVSDLGESLRWYKRVFWSSGTRPIPRKPSAVTYAVPTRADLRAWVDHLDALGVENSGALRGIIGWVLVFRDPDGLAVRLYTREHHEFDEAHADVDSRWLRLSADAKVVDAKP